MSELKPQWVITGQTQPNGRVVVMASTEVYQSTLEIGRTRSVPLLVEEYFMPTSLADTTCSLTVTMDGMVMIEAATYEQAFAALFEHWSPAGEQPSPALTDGHEPPAVTR